jgi:DNA-3-methyladenine glycosylase II
MVRTKQSIGTAVKALAEREPAFARVVDQFGVPEPRNSEPGAQTLLRTIVGQQVSVAAARSMWSKLEAAFGSPPD